MAMPGQVQGGLGAMAPPKPPAQPTEAQDAARVSAMEQDTILSPEDVARKALTDRNAQSLALEERINLLSKSLGSRLNPGFDMPLMQMAAGFLKPTRTGSFGESLGYGMENYTKATQEDMVQRQAIEKQRLEYLQKLADIQGQRGITDFQLADIGAPSKTTLRTGAESAPAGAPAMPPPAESGQGAPAGAAPVSPALPPVSKNPMTVDRAKMAGFVNPALGKSAFEQLEAERKQTELKIKQKEFDRAGTVPTAFGIWNPDTRKFERADPYLQKTETFDFGALNPPGQNSRPATQDQIRKFALVDKRDPQALVDFAVGEGWLAAKPTAAAGSATPPTGGEVGKPAVDPLGRLNRIKSAEELAAETAQREVDAVENKKYAEAAGEMAGELRKTALQSNDVKLLAQEAGSIARAAPNAFKLLMNKDSALRTSFDAYLQIAKTGMQAGQLGTFSIPADIIQKNDLKDVEIQALQKYAQIEAQFTMLNRRTWLQGQGAISNGENNLAAQLGPQITDRPEVIQMKAQALERKADFDNSVFQAFEEYKTKGKGGFSKFLSSSTEYQALKDGYIKDLDLMRNANARHFSGEKAPAATESYSQRLARLAKERAKGNP